MRLKTETLKNIYVKGLSNYTSSLFMFMLPNAFLMPVCSQQSPNSWVLQKQATYYLEKKHQYPLIIQLDHCRILPMPNFITTNVEWDCRAVNYTCPNNCREILGAGQVKMLKSVIYVSCLPYTMICNAGQVAILTLCSLDWCYNWKVTVSML